MSLAKKLSRSDLRPPQPMAEIKKMFFSTTELNRRLEAGQRRVLSRYGAYVRQTAKRSIKKQPMTLGEKAKRNNLRDASGRFKKGATIHLGEPRRRPATPGRPPGNVKGLLKKFIFFAYDENKRSVVIGPARLARARSDNLMMLEFGGSRTVKGIRQTYPERPFMGPADEANRSRMPEMFRDSI